MPFRGCVAFLWKIRSDEILIVTSTDTVFFFFLHNFACCDSLVFFFLNHLQFCCDFIEKSRVCNKLISTTSVYLSAY